ncbi:DUF2336 domain-containing protein [Parvularcula flava]|uniref:DUF2336 domain-containing protein n=1 Tax=Aquisalinus luteolus TaxID=1566827 RepID=A0A8J3A9M3_9PROT|nr:DUF2336 domain-containing protein [Aquisalinus luteolus]NHK29554.1 DUF2336 domain-containing protein [Aquisalinus luteolus]GGI01590.1 hypothetical protein GCM10011355_32600 [Aquisalinus luteolus]
MAEQARVMEQHHAASGPVAGPGEQLTLSGQMTTRMALVRKLTDIVVLPLGKISGNERSFAADILIRTLLNVDTPARVEVAHRLAGITDIPRHLQRYLMTSDIEIARPMLETRTHVPETMLMEAAACSREHRQIIMRRDDLTPAVADALIRHGEGDIMRRLLDKDEVLLSDQAMTTIIHKSRTDEHLREPLLKRLELRPDQAFVMYWWMNTSQRKHLLKRFMTDRSVIQEAMHELFVVTFTSDNPDTVVKSSLKLIDRRHRPRGRNGEMVTMDIVQKTLTAARCQPTHEFAHAVGLLAGVSTDTAEMVLFDVTGVSFAIICKSIGLSRSAFREVISDSRFADEGSSAILNEDQVDDLVGIFDSIARDFSRTILRYWDWKTDMFVIGEEQLAQNGQSDVHKTYFGEL